MTGLVLVALPVKRAFATSSLFTLHLLPALLQPGVAVVGGWLCCDERPLLEGVGSVQSAAPLIRRGGAFTDPSSRCSDAPPRAWLPLRSFSPCARSLSSLAHRACSEPLCADALSGASPKTFSPLPDDASLRINASACLHRFSRSSGLSLLRPPSSSSTAGQQGRRREMAEGAGRLTRRPRLLGSPRSWRPAHARDRCTVYL